MGVILVDRNKLYVTYSDTDTFDMDRIMTNTNLLPEYNCKPMSALWGSPVNAEYGWKEWCEDNEYDYKFDHPIYWRLKEGTKILTIDRSDVEDEDHSILQKYITIKFDSRLFDFKKMKEDGIDAVELLDACVGHFGMNRLEMMFNSWDCESIVVLNPSKIILKSSL